MAHRITRDSAQSMVAWLLDEAVSFGAAEADVLYVCGQSQSIELRDGELEDQASGMTRGVSLRTLDGHGRQGVAYTNRLDHEALTNLVKWSLSNCRLAEPRDGIGLLDSWDGLAEQLPGCDESVYALTPQVRYDKCMEMTTEARKDSRVMSVRGASWSDGWGECFCASSNGMSYWELSTVVSCGVAVVMGNGDDIEMGGNGESSRRLDSVDNISVAALAIETTGMVLGGKTVPTGQYTLVLDPQVAASLIDEVGGLFSASAVHKNCSLMKGRLGTKVASGAVTLVDDGRVPWGMASSTWDSEGVPTGRTVLISEGVANAYLYNLEYARIDGVKSTGNGARGLTSVPDVANTNLHILPGSSSRDELLKSTGRGIYITDLMGLHTLDEVSGDFSFGARGCVIDGGALGGPVSGVTIAGNLLDFLERIVAVGDDFKYYGSVGSCTLVVDNVSVAGS